MHLLVRETRSLDEDAPAQELGHDPAPIVVLSFSDADLGALAAAWTDADPPMRLVPLARLRHPMSVDLYIEQVAQHARCIVLRLLGGLDYFRYGAEELAALCRARGIALAVLPGDAADDTRLRALSTVPAEAWSALDAAFRGGGAANDALVLRWAGHLAGLAPRPLAAAVPVPPHGVHALDLCGGAAFAAIVFYRSHLLSHDLAPLEALAAALRREGMAVGLLYAASLKAPGSAAFVARTLAAWRPAVVLNATAFSARAEAGPSPLDAPDVPVLQLVLSGSRRAAWAESRRGLSPTDLAMHVVLPELDGRLLTGAISFKAELPAHPALQHARTVHAPDADGVALAAARAAGWVRLAQTPRAERRLAVVLSDYPGIGGQQGHAIGLDTFASTAALLDSLDGYAVERPDAAAIASGLCDAPPAPILSVAAYEALLARLPDALRAALHAAWGPPADDPAVVAGAFTARHLRCGNALVALQPDRGAAAERRAQYHDPDLPPRHAFVAFHLWLRHGAAVHALVHVGAHGSLEWLPGKAAALSASCWPNALLGGLPVVYPFIVNNPGEAAPAKRRLGAVTLGHLAPPLAATPHHGAAAALERLFDEYAAADGLDRRRGQALRTRILDEAAAAGLLRECGAPADDPDASLARLDAYLCDVKDMQVRHGLHVYGRAAPGADAARAGSARMEAANLLAALDGRHVPPGPAGAPSRGRSDVMPTGRNLVTTDPRTVPTRTAMELAAAAAAALLQRHLAEQGEYPRQVLLDVWGSATMRTGGEEIALAFHLLGARPLWDAGSARVSGFEIVPLALMDRPRIDVTLRVSGLFRDAFGPLLTLFDSLVRTLAARDEAADWNPLAARPGPRVFGPAEGAYGAGDGTGASWRAASLTALGHAPGPDAAALDAAVAGADAFVHSQDHREHDLLDSPEWAAHEGGFAQAAAALGARPALYHLDTSQPGAPVARTVAEEVARVVRSRAANPAWLATMMRHGRAGAAEMARPLAALEAFARTLPSRFDAQFDLLHDALTEPAVDAFLQAENPAAHRDVHGRFAEARAAGLWHPRRNRV